MQANLKKRVVTNDWRGTGGGNRSVAIGSAAGGGHRAAAPQTVWLLYFRSMQLLRRLLAGSKPQPGRSTANYCPILHPGHSLQAGQRTCYTSWRCRKHTRAGLVPRGARMGQPPTRIRLARLCRRKWPSVASRPPRGRVPWTPSVSALDGANKRTGGSEVLIRTPSFNR